MVALVDANAVQVLGNTGTSTNSITPTLPTGLVNGRSRVWVVACHTHAYGSTPAGWTAFFTDLVVGSGTPAAAAGFRYVSAFYRDKDASWSTMPAFVMTNVANGSHALASWSIATTAAGYSWDTPTYTTTPGVDSSAGTAFATGNTSGFVTHLGGYLTAICANNAGRTLTPTSFTHTGTSVAGGTLTERGDAGTTTGFDVGMAYYSSGVSASSGASNPFTFSGTFSATVTASGSGVVFIEQTETAPPPPAPISDLVDDFNTGSTPDPALWTTTSGSPSLSSGELLLNTGDQIDSVHTYDLTGDACYFQTKNMTADGLVEFDNDVAAAFYWNSSSQVEVYDDDGATGVTRTHTNGDWYRLRASGTTMFWDYSTNGTSWTNLHSTSIAGADITGTRVLFATGGATCRYDNVNTLGAVPPTGSMFFSQH